MKFELEKKSHGIRIVYWVSLKKSFDRQATFYVTCFWDVTVNYLESTGVGQVGFDIFL